MYAVWRAEDPVYGAPKLGVQVRSSCNYWYKLGPNHLSSKNVLKILEK